MLLNQSFNKIVFLLFIVLYASNSYARQPCNKYLQESCSCSPPKNGYCITAGGKKYTYYAIAKDIKRLVAPDTNFDLKPIEGGSVINIKRMRWQNGVKLAIVQSDVLEYYKAEERKGNKIANQMIHPLRVILPLYNEEIHIFARKKSSINSFKDLEGKRIALGSLNGGSAMTGRAIYQYMFGKELGSSAFYSSKDDALRALIKDKTVDAWIMVVGQPAPRFKNDMRTGTEKLLKLISFDENDFQEAKILNGPYFKAKIWAKNYPWLDHDVPTITVKAFLISQVYKKEATRKYIQNFTKSLCKNFGELRSHGHEKWKEVELKQVALSGGWKYSDDALAAFSTPECKGQIYPPPLPTKTCSQDEAVLGLCVK